MTDGGFYLTPVDVRAQEFRKSLRGYDPGDVDEFRNRIADELERLLKE
ncbi:MAG: DivIVA domain-containing protein, partial [Gemmatimonadetes bacterium]|nr:DivIVA domain-containing protein [Gemmatimonadota bacterium]